MTFNGFFLTAADSKQQYKSKELVIFLKINWGHSCFVAMIKYSLANTHFSPPLLKKVL